MSCSGGGRRRSSLCRLARSAAIVCQLLRVGDRPELVSDARLDVTAAARGSRVTAAALLAVAAPPPSYSRKIGSGFARIARISASRSSTGPVRTFSCGKMTPPSSGCITTAPSSPRCSTTPARVCWYTYSAGVVVDQQRFVVQPLFEGLCRRGVAIDTWECPDRAAG